MNSFHEIPIHCIIVKREERQRHDAKDGVEELGRSIKRSGLINPIVVTRDSILVSGERRLEAYRWLNAKEPSGQWSSIMAQYIDEVGDDQRYLIELEENIRRRGYAAGEEYHAVAEYCRRRKAIDPNVTQHEVARSLEYSDPWISRCLAYARDKDNPIVKNAPTPDAGLKLLAVKREAQAEAQEEMLFATLTGC
jgi:ParB/RepB/Spo0J family partition protein